MKHKADVVLLSSVILAGIVFALFLVLFSRPGTQVRVRVAGEIVAVYPLNQDGTYEIEGVNGGTNRLVIENGTAAVTQASCPDKLCVHMGRISESGQSIVCLPNQVVVDIISRQSEKDLDAVAG